MSACSPPCNTRSSNEGAIQLHCCSLLQRPEEWLNACLPATPWSSDAPPFSPLSLPCRPSPSSFLASSSSSSSSSFLPFAASLTFTQPPSPPSSPSSSPSSPLNWDSARLATRRIMESVTCVRNQSGQAIHRLILFSCRPSPDSAALFSCSGARGKDDAVCTIVN